MASFVSTGRKIVAIGRNYAKHAKELGNAVPDKPFFFLKPTTSYVSSGGKVEIPRGVIVHHEVELGVVIGKTGRDIAASRAPDFVAGYGEGSDANTDMIPDMLDFIPKSSISDPTNVNLWLKINGEFRQNGTTADMIFNIPQLIEHVSSIMTLEEGDLILTGTPEGVGAIKAGDTVTAGIQLPGSDTTLASLELDVVDRGGGYVFEA
ncbi:SubName: Full=Related to C.elegans ZK688.3 protein and E.coli hpcEp {ECO:0000313/EMBL:CCA73352.1} [Serendipita indica DSM 11827]|nr:SubName: Full=Related to C.elegans ZK688.3 protein and E.coli hpcEp {ECO:0000313/EMBL:CCA73352.1} [Serendipita indica DSM 11827]